MKYLLNYLFSVFLLLTLFSCGGSDDDDAVTYVGNQIFTLIGNIFFKLN